MNNFSASVSGGRASRTSKSAAMSSAGRPSARRKLRNSGVGILAVLCLFASSGEGQSNSPKIDEILKQLEKARAYSSVSISPDGRWVTWTQAAASGSRDSEIYLLDRQTGAA